MPISTVEHLANRSGIPVKHWFWLGYNANGLYDTWDIPKRNGSVRHIASPANVLRQAQHFLKTEVLDPLPIDAHAMAYAIERNTALAAQPHVAKPLVIRTDIADFFPSIGITSVRRVFYRAGWDDVSSRVMARVCLYLGGLAQGAITSPALSNLIMVSADRDIAAITNMFSEGEYTRYSDDMYFSWNEALGKNSTKRFIRLLSNILDRNGFMLNYAKTQIMLGDETRQGILGLVVNEHRTLPRDWKHNLRAGLFSTQRDLNNGSISEDEYNFLMRSLAGRYYYAKGIDPIYAAKLLEQYPQLGRNVND